MAELGVGQQTNEYAQQFNDLSALDDNPVAMQRKAAAKANAQALAEKAEKAGAKPPSFKAAVKETAPEKSKLPENDVFKRNSAYAQKADKYQTDLLPEEEAKFQAWVKQNKVPWQDKPDADYDMRGYWKAQQGGDPSAAQSMNSNDNKMHFPDTYKTPYHKSFSNESRYANPATAPKWNDQDQLVTPDGKVVFDEKAENAPPKPAPGDMKVPLGAGGEADIRKDTNARIAATIREKHPEYKDVPDDKITDGLYNKYYADKMTRDEFNEKVGAKHATEDADKATGVDNALEPITSIPGNIAENVSEGVKTFGSGLATPGSKSFFPSSNPLKMIAGAAQVVGAPALGAAKSLVGDPLRETLPDTPGGRAVAGTAEAVASVPLGGVEALGAKAIGKGASAIKNTSKGFVDTVMGKPAAKQLSEVRGGIIGDIGKGALENRTAADTAGKRAESLESQKTQVMTEAEKRAQVLKDQEEQARSRAGLDEKGLPRAELATKNPPPGQTAGLEQKGVKSILDARVNDLTARAEKAGQTTEQARAAAETRSAELADARTEAEKLDNDLKSQPQMEAKDFGGRLYSTLAEMKKKYTAIRKKESGYDEAIAAAGDKPIVDTEPALKALEEGVKTRYGSRPDDNPILSTIRKRLTDLEGDKAVNKLSPSAADALRQDIADYIDTKIVGERSVDKSTAYILGKVREALEGPLAEASPAIKEAREKWAKLSEPLDIFGYENKGNKEGAFKGLLSGHPGSVDAAVTNSDMVGHIISKANSGNKAFDRLLQENPDLREPARLYFMRDLFAEGKNPSEAALKSWLVRNKGSLDQLGLYDEFSSIPRAKAAAKRAVDEASGNLKQSAGEAKAAEQREEGIRRDLAKQNKLRAKLSKDMEAGEKGKTTREDIEKGSAKSVKEGTERLASRREKLLKESEGKVSALDTEKKGALKEQGKATSIAEQYDTFKTMLERKPDKGAAKATRDMIQKLRDDGRIDVKSYGELLDKITEIETKQGQTAQARKILSAIGLSAIVASGGGYYAFKAAQALLP